MHSPIKYYGGKSNMVDIIKEKFPKDYSTYIEGFGGGASILLNKEPSDMEIYNDLGKNVYSLFYVLSDKKLFNQLKEKLDLTYYSREIRQEFKQKLEDKNISILDRAFYFIYVNRSSFNGVGGFSVSKVVRRKMSKSTSDYLSMIEHLPEIHDRLSTTIVENLDILDLIDKYDSDKSFFFLDPPYVKSTRLSNQTYECEMTDEEHKNMLNKLNLIKGKALICGYDNELYAEYLKDWNKYSFKAPNAKSEAIETIWMNY